MINVRLMRAVLNELNERGCESGMNWGWFCFISQMGAVNKTPKWNMDIKNKLAKVEFRSVKDLLLRIMLFYK